MADTIQCDEGQPVCAFCAKRGLTCEYVINRKKSTTTPSTESSPFDDRRSSEGEEMIRDQSSSPEELYQISPPAASSQSGVLSRHDMRAMHFWSLFTSQTVAPGHFANQILAVTLPQLAFENPYLMDVMLGVSSLHLQSLVTSSPSDRRQTSLYRANAFSGFREALPLVSPKVPGSWESALLTSIMLTMLTAKDFPLEEGDLHCLHWINLYRGLSTVIALGQFEQVMSSVVAPLFKRSLTDLKTEPVVPYSLYEMLQNVSPGDPDFPFLSTYRENLDYIGVLYASLIQDGNSAALQTRVVSWCSLVGTQGALLAKEKRPRMLILLAHYMVFVKICSRDVWWMEGTAEGDIARIFRMVPPRYFHLLELPRACAGLENVDDVVDMMLR